MKYVAIFTILGIIPYVGNFLGLIKLILLFLCLNDIKNANMKLNNALLNNYRSKYFTALILVVFTLILNIIGLFPPFNSFKLVFHIVNLTISIDLLFIPVLTLFIIIGVIEMVAWQRFIDFTIQSSILFPLSIQANIIKGSKNLKNAALMNILIFLIITIFIGWILQIIGFFRLSNLEHFYYEEPQISTVTVSKPKREAYNKDNSFSKFEKKVYQFLKENAGKAFTFTAILNRIIDTLEDENEKEYFKINGEELLNQLSLRKHINVVVRKGEVFYLIA